MNSQFHRKSMNENLLSIDDAEDSFFKEKNDCPQNSDLFGVHNFRWVKHPCIAKAGI